VLDKGSQKEGKFWMSKGSRDLLPKTLKPQLDGEQVQLVGEVDDTAKEPFLANAAALLFPIDWPEPFGLVMIEAMACGTPVIAFPSGSVREVVDDGVTGFVVKNETDAVSVIQRLGELDRREIRAHFEERFTSRRMAQEYVTCYQTLVRSNRKMDAPSRSETETISSNSRGRASHAIVDTTLDPAP
jgi:glycosyltransferase involved in cell wall biosynthesis